VKNILAVKGKVVSGLGEGTYMTQLDWVKSQCQEKFGFLPHPGTFNVRLDAGESKRYAVLKKYRGIKILPPSSAFVAAKCFSVQLGPIKGMLAIPMLDDYPQDILEILAPIWIREALGVKEGDDVEVRIQL
jgi:riboflavin kinase